MEFYVAVGYASKSEKLAGYLLISSVKRVNMHTGFIEYCLHLLISSYVDYLVLFSANLQFHQLW